MKLTEAKLKALIIETMEEESESLSPEEINNLLEIAESDPEHGVFILESMLDEISEEQLEQIKSKLARTTWRKGLLEAALRFMFLDKEYPDEYEKHEPEKMDSLLNSMSIKNTSLARELLEKYDIYHDVIRDTGRIEIGEIVGYRDDVFFAIRRFFDLELDRQRYSFYLHKHETKPNGMVIEEGHISKKSYQGEERELRVNIEFAYVTNADSGERNMEILTLEASTSHEDHHKRTRAIFDAGHGGRNSKRSKGDVSYFIRFGIYSGRQDMRGTTSSVQVPILIENTFSESGWRL